MLAVIAATKNIEIEKTREERRLLPQKITVEKLKMSMAAIQIGMA